MSRRLLLVDDEDSIREIAQISLERVGGWEVIAAASGREAIEMARRITSFDAVILDVMMPGLDGPSTMRALREGPISGAVPFVFLTAKLQAVDRERLGEIGAAGVIAKPFDPMTLSEQLERILDGPTVADARSGELIDPGFAELWSRNREVIEARVEAISEAVAFRACDGQETAGLAEAISAAHMLSGSLGTFGLQRGSELAQRLEAGLGTGEPTPLLQALSDELTELVAASNSALAHSVSEPPGRLDKGGIT